MELPSGASLNNNLKIYFSIHLFIIDYLVHYQAPKLASLYFEFHMYQGFLFGEFYDSASNIYRLWLTLTSRLIFEEKRFFDRVWKPPHDVLFSV